MKTYAETQGKKKFDWFSVLTKKYMEDGANGPIDEELYDLSAQWPTCACGNLCDAIPRRKSDGCPKNKKLAELGSEFCDKVGSGDWLEAIGIFTLIEQQSATILHNMRKRRLNRQNTTNKTKKQRRLSNGRFA